jgi:hypothetical protein
MTTSTCSAWLNAPVADGGTFVAPYPAGATRDDFSSVDVHRLYVNQSEYVSPTDFLLIFNASTITVTWRGGYALRQGATVRLDLTNTTRLGSTELLLSPTNPFTQILSPLSTGDYSASLGVLSDSTGNETADWVYRLLAEKLGPALPDIRIVYRVWNDVSQDFDAEVVVQAGASGERRLVFLGDGDYRYVPYDEPPARASADFDVRIRVKVPDWTPAANTWFAGQMGSAGNRGWEIGLRTDGRSQFYWSPDGTAITLNVQSTNPLGITDGTWKWLRATLVAATGVATAYIGDDGVTWTQVGQSTAGATTIFDSNANIVIGNAGGSGTFAGEISHVEIRDGIGGPIRNVQPIEAWFPRPTPTVTVAGSPTLSVFNGSQSGADLDYLSDSTRFPKMLPIGDAQVVVLATQLNDAGDRMGALYTKWAALIDAARTRCPTASLVMLTENPTHTITNVAARRSIPYSLHGIAQRKGVPLIDNYRVFRRALDAGVPSIDLIGDGVHPSQPLGVDLTVNEVWRVMAQRLTY